MTHTIRYWTVKSVHCRSSSVSCMKMTRVAIIPNHAPFEWIHRHWHLLGGNIQWYYPPPSATSHLATEADTSPHVGHGDTMTVMKSLQIQWQPCWSWRHRQFQEICRNSSDSFNCFKVIVTIILNIRGNIRQYWTTSLQHSKFSVTRWLQI